MSVSIDRVPPHDLDAERSVLGSCFLSASAFDEVVGLVEDWMFYAEAHRLMWRVVSEHHIQGHAVDVVTVTQTINKHGWLDDIGGVAYLNEVMATVPHAAHAEYYADIVRQKALRRKVIHQSQDLIRTAYDDTANTDQVLEKAEASITDMIESREGDEAVSLDNLLLSAFDEIGQTRKVGLPTGFIELDDLTGGMHGGQLIVLAARPGMGKSALALSIASNLARNDFPVLFHALEMSKLELVERVVSMESGIALSKMRSGELDSEDHGRLSMEANCLSMWPVWINDDSYVSALQIASSARLQRRKNKICCVIVDYLQLIESPDKRISREQQVAEVTRTLKRLAKSLDIPVIALAQLNRNVESQKDKRPQLSDLRESGAIEQDADQVWMLYRAKEYSEFAENLNHSEWSRIRHDYHFGSYPVEDVAELFVRKNRSGPKGAIPLRYKGPCTLFQTVSRQSSQF